MSALADVATPALEWAVTYLLHSTILLGLAALLTARWVRSDVWREVLWRGAVLGPVLTATLAATLSLPTLAGPIEVPGLDPESSAIVGSTGEEAVAGRGAAGERAVVPHDRAARSEPTAPASGRTADGVSAPARVAGGWSGVLLLVWAGGSAGLLGVLLVRNLVLFRRLRGRRTLEEGSLPAMLAELRRQAGVWRPVRLSVSGSCSTPLVIGSAEICVPPRFLNELDEDAQRAALTHEVAHVRRRDPEWQLGTGLLGALLFFQPLLLLARLRLREASEHLCDDWTVRQTGSPVPLGRCLTEIASWTSAAPPLRLGGTPAMAEGGAPLLHRIRRIAAGVPAVAERRRWAVLAVGASLLATVAAAPVVGGKPTAERTVPDRTAGSGTAKDGVAGSSASSDTLEAIRLLEELAMGDPSPRIRQEAAAGLSDFDDPEAARALSRIVRSASDPEVRSEAAQQLDEFPTEEVVAVLLEVVFADPDADVRETALFTLADFRMPSARAALRQVAREHPDTEVRVTALDALTDDG